jgi:hypothetical protein
MFGRQRTKTSSMCTEMYRYTLYKIGTLARQRMKDFQEERNAGDRKLKVGVPLHVSCFLDHYGGGGASNNRLHLRESQRETKYCLFHCSPVMNVRMYIYM